MEQATFAVATNSNALFGGPKLFFSYYLFLRDRCQIVNTDLVDTDMQVVDTELCTPAATLDLSLTKCEQFNFNKTSC